MLSDGGTDGRPQYQSEKPELDTLHFVCLGIALFWLDLLIPADSVEVPSRSLYWTGFGLSRFFLQECTD